MFSKHIIRNAMEEPCSPANCHIGIYKITILSACMASVGCVGQQDLQNES